MTMVGVSTPKRHDIGHSHVPQPIAPIIIPANIEEERAPIVPSDTKPGHLGSADEKK